MQASSSENAVQHRKQPDSRCRRYDRRQPILPVSFFIVSSVVLHGECIKVNSTAETAVIAVHPLPESTSERAAYELISVRQLPEVYAISIIGITSSFASSPKMNAASIPPSSPISLAAG